MYVIFLNKSFVPNLISLNIWRNVGIIWNEFSSLILDCFIKLRFNTLWTLIDNYDAISDALCKSYLYICYNFQLSLNTLENINSVLF